MDILTNRGSTDTTYDTTADMQASARLKDGDRIIVLGGSATNDGGGQGYFINTNNTGLALQNGLYAHAEQVVQDTRLDTLESRADTTDTEQDAQDARLDALETGGPGGGVSSVNDFTGDVVLSAGSNVTIVDSGNGVEISATGGGSVGVESLNSMVGNLSIVQGNNITITEGSDTISVQVNWEVVSSLPEPSGYNEGDVVLLIDQA